MLQWEGTSINAQSDLTVFITMLRKKHLCFVSVLKQCQKACWGCWVSSVLCHTLLVTMNRPLLAGRISISDWAAVMESVLQLKLPWRMLRSRLVKTDPDGKVDYMSCFCYMDTARPMHQVRRETHPFTSRRNSFWCSLRHKAVAWPIQ